MVTYCVLTDRQSASLPASPSSSAFTTNSRLSPLSAAFTHFDWGVGSRPPDSFPFLATLPMPFCSHQLTNCASSNFRLFTTFCVAGGWHPRRFFPGLLFPVPFLATRHSPLATASCLLLPLSLQHFRPCLRFFSIAYSRFLQTPRGGLKFSTSIPQATNHPSPAASHQPRACKQPRSTVTVNTL